MRPLIDTPLHAAAALLIFALPTTALAGRCEELAKPREFTADTAMEAIFCEYDRAQQGTLLPLPATRGWQLGKASQLAIPHLTRTYSESG